MCYQGKAFSQTVLSKEGHGLVVTIIWWQKQEGKGEKVIKQHCEVSLNLQILHSLIDIPTEMPPGTRNIEEEKEEEEKQPVMKTDYSTNVTYIATDGLLLCEGQ